jgi:hypothetical protein
VASKRKPNVPADPLGTLLRAAADAAADAAVATWLRRLAASGERAEGVLPPPARCEQQRRLETPPAGG